MIAAPASTRLDAVSRLIAGRLGLHYPPPRLSEMERLLGRAAREAGCPDLDALIDGLFTADPGDRRFELVASALTVGETYFFRDPAIFDLIAEHLLPRFGAAKADESPRFRAWSAGCCTGEEAYTLAIEFDRRRPQLPGCTLDLLATDINPQFLRQARAGIYRPWSFRGAPPWLQAGYFTPLAGDRFEIRADLRAGIRFAPLNLVEYAYPALQNRTNGMHLILCRHVLMYFTPEQFARSVHHLARCLVEGGWLVVSAAEVSHIDDPELTPTRLGEATIFVKRGPARRSPAGGPPWFGRDWSLATGPAEGAKARAARGVEIGGESSPALELAAIPAAADPECPALESGSGAPESTRDVPPAPFPVRGALPAAEGAAADDGLAEARAQASRGELARARESCDHLLRADKMHAATHYLRASILQEEGASAEAERALRRVLYLEPDFIAAHLALASLARSDGRPAEARRHLRTARTLAGRLRPGEIVPESGGLSAARLAHFLDGVLEKQLPPGGPARAGAWRPRPATGPRT